jgi:hypothetical protein
MPAYRPGTERGPDMERVLLVVGLVLVCVLCGYGLLVGWRHRAARQSALPELPAAPDDLGPDLAPPLTGVYVSTTTAGNWQDRVVACGLGRRAAGAARLSVEGVCVEREGESDIYLPIADLVQVTTAPGIAGKVMGQAEGVLIVRWKLGETLLDSGFRADDTELQADWIVAANELIAARPKGRSNDSPSTNGAPS